MKENSIILAIITKMLYNIRKLRSIQEWTVFKQSKKTRGRDKIEDDKALQRQRWIWQDLSYDGLCPHVRTANSKG